MLLYYVPFFPFIRIEKTDVCFFSTYDRNDLVTILLTVFCSSILYPLEGLIYGYFCVKILKLYRHLKFLAI